MGNQGREQESPGQTTLLPFESETETLPAEQAEDYERPFAIFPLEPVDAEDQRAKSPWFRFWRDLVVGAVIVACLHAFIVQVSIVRGMSMSPSLYDGDRLMVDRVAYSIGDVSRFDVVILSYPMDPTVDFVKRVIGLPGDRVTLRQGEIFLDGRKLRERFPHRADENYAEEVIVPEGHVFVLGDNRPVSCDSRSFGMVPITSLKGKVRCRFWPLTRLAFF